MNIIKIFIIIIALGILGGIIYLAFNIRPDTNIDQTIANFNECVAAGYPILKSYPGQCATADGRTFVDGVFGNSTTTDLIKIDEPKASSTIKSPLGITGQARGQWFFEATFPIALYDSNGTEITRHFAEAKGEWMTNDFVPFSATLPFEMPKTKTGTLVLEKSNPSGLPEHSDSISIPVNFAEFDKSGQENPRASGGCMITGCSSQVCADRETATNCEYPPIYACYKTAQCGRNAEGVCEWKETPALLACIEKSSADGEDPH